MIFLVGDNPFHGISHLSQERVRVRGDAATSPDYAAGLVMTSVENGANGFMFSVSDTTLSILRIIRQRGNEPLSLYALVPYAYEYVRLATQVGGISGLAKKLAGQLVLSANLKAVAMGLKGVIGADSVALLKAYVSYEVSRIRSAAGKSGKLESVLLHEIITDLALGLNLNHLFESYVDFMLKLGIKPGFETRNFSYFVSRLKELGIDLHDVMIATPFNKVGFQMNPSRSECEKVLAQVPESDVIAMSILAAGYLNLPEAIEYIEGLPNLKGIVVGVSKERHACETFRLLQKESDNRVRP
ncbi:MAG: hypothetical protein ABSF24_03360 [Candidatus Bathyarchaeia archaeon]|jgi:hypothetical protein